MTLTTDRFNEIYENPEQCSYSEIQEMAAMLASREAQPVEGTQFKPVADLFALGWVNGEVCSFVTDSDKAFYWLTGYTGTCVQEYVKLERLQEAYTAPPAPAAIDEVADLTKERDEALARLATPVRLPNEKAASAMFDIFYQTERNNGNVQLGFSDAKALGEWIAKTLELRGDGFECEVGQ